ncbi:Uncharacterised protein [Sphingobacterium multivorum]|uniref:hypothetical protein n=1 Tax=Sphingobacterium multivorum TaxID=28454 RepID=UPI000DF89B5C|nr:hypothetical protein [Sphingobacterium multivorum]QQT43308.1 hypothetical protein I6J00_16310 [Sphingobacterium multivorum]SUI98748.1 Uncharacterised protein [Sphingobacterium multivorum]
MEIKLKLSLILNRIKLVLKNDIRTNYSEEYAKGFQHAALLFHVAMQKEFGRFIQIDQNKHQEIRDLKKQIENLEMQIITKNSYIEEVDLIKSGDLSNKKKRKIYLAISEMTGQPYEYVRDKFSAIIGQKKWDRNGL